MQPSIKVFHVNPENLDKLRSGEKTVSFFHETDDVSTGDILFLQEAEGLGVYVEVKYADRLPAIEYISLGELNRGGYDSITELKDAMRACHIDPDGAVLLVEYETVAKPAAPKSGRCTYHAEKKPAGGVRFVFDFGTE